MTPGAWPADLSLKGRKPAQHKNNERTDTSQVLFHLYVYELAGTLSNAILHALFSLGLAWGLGFYANVNIWFNFMFWTFAVSDVNITRVALPSWLTYCVGICIWIILLQMSTSMQQAAGPNAV